MTPSSTIKTRFPPSPTGTLHVGGARTALFSWLVARRAGGHFILRIEDTDQARNVPGGAEAIIRDLKWLGLDWDEGPYLQSQRLDIYAKHIQKLLDAGHAYYAFETAEELDVLRKQAQEAKQAFRYPRPDPLPTAADADRARSAGKPVVVRLKCPSQAVTVEDEVFGEVQVAADQMDDFVICKANGYPTYHLANVVDDALMGINFILRGQEFLGQTWRHIVLRQALGYPQPRYAHLPLILDMQGKKLSKRDADVDVHSFRRAGFLPEALVNFIVLLGWSPGDNREKFSLAQLREVFDVADIGKSNARFDLEKLRAFNTDACADAAPDRLLTAFKDYLSLNDTPIPADDDNLLAQVLEVCKGFRTFADIPAKVGVLFQADADFEYDTKAVKKVLRKNDAAGFAVLAQLREVLSKCDWQHEILEACINDYCRTKELSMGQVAQPIRVAVTGRTVSPQIIDTLMILGHDKTLARIDRCLDLPR
ncbi:MAG: glutamate--tRNA ligase [Actinobacteria bacterium]|nr:glutamate--tRNA ligase [Actinomycetota bacterium]